MRVEAAQLRALLDAWPVARLATTTAGSDRPHIVPIVFCRLADALYSPIDGKPKASRELKRLRNVRANPQVAVLLDHYDDDWQRLWWLRLDARAEVSHLQDPRAVEVGSALRRKYAQYDSVPLFQAGSATCLRIAWQRVTGWAPGGFDAVLESLADPG